MNFLSRKTFKVCSQRLWSSAYAFRAGRSLSGFAYLLFNLGGERLYLLLLLGGRCLQVLNCLIEHRLLGGIGNGLGPDAAFGRKSTRIGSIHGDRAQSSIGIDHHNSGRGGGNRRTENIVDRAPVTDLAKNTVHTRVVADDDIVIRRW